MAGGKAPKVIIVLVTCPTKKIGELLAKHLVSQRLAACVNVLGPIQSIYRWQGKVEEASEALLLIKTEKRLFGRLKSALLRKHPYTTPEIMAIPVAAGEPNYLNWIRASLVR